MDLPASLQLARTLNEQPVQALQQLESQSKDLWPVLRPVLPYLTLPTLLILANRPSCSCLFPAEASDEIKSRTLSETLDSQRDWLVEECPAALRDEYLVSAFEGEGAAWTTLQQEGHFQLKMPEGCETVVTPTKTTTKGQPCTSLQQFQSKLKEVSGGSFEKLDWSNVCLGGGSVLGIVTGKIDDPTFKDSDFDLFLYGLEPGQLIPKVASIIEQIRSTLPEPAIRSTPPYEFDWDDHHTGELLLVKGFNAISIIPPYGVKPRKVVQIITATNPSIVDAVGQFDLDACCIAYDGSKVLALPRAVRSLALGDWTWGVNFLDTRPSRKLDPSSGTVASRAVKYKPRGFGLALPPAAAAVLKAEKIDFAALLRKGQAEAAKEGQKTPVEDLKGLSVLLRREVNSKKEGRTKTQLYADYGPSTVPYWMVTESSDLAYARNGRLQHSYAEFNKKLAEKIVVLMATADASSIVQSKAMSSNYLSTWAVPYVASFDDQLILGLKDPKDVTEKYFFSHLQNQQLVAKIPRSILPIADVAQKRLNAITAAAACAGSSGGPAPKKAKSPVAPPILTEIEEIAVSDALAALKLASVDPPAIPSRMATTTGDEVIPESLPGPFRSLGPRRDVLPKGKGALVSPLIGLNGEEEAVCKKLLPASYFVATLGGLLQFKGLDPEIDRVKDAIWQAWCITARAAVSLPQEVPDFLEEDFEYLGKMGKDAMARYRAQPSMKQVTARMDAELANLEELIKKSGQKPAARAKIGEWDADRKRWLLQWVRDVDMV